MKKNNETFLNLKTLSSLSFIVFLFSSHLLFSCTRILMENKYGVLVGRNMDWSDWQKADYKILVFPKGQERSGETEINPLTWRSLYGSVVVSMYDFALAEGINEKGLSAMVLYLPNSHYGIRDESKKGIYMPIWNQFFLDNFATVEEAVNYWRENKDTIQIVSTPLPFSQGYPVCLHVALQDSTGDSAFIEYTSTQGEVTIYHGRDYNVLTNQPPYLDQLENLETFKKTKENFREESQEKKRGFSAIFDIFEPAFVNGYSRPKDRFVRATYYASLAQNKEPENYTQHLSQMRGLMGNIAQLILPSDGFETDRTNYTTLSDLTNMKFYMTMIDFNNFVSIDIKKLNLEEGAPNLYFDVNRINAHGDITNKLQILPENLFLFANEIKLRS